jgi:hypothetical protein
VTTPSPKEPTKGLSPNGSLRLRFVQFTLGNFFTLFVTLGKKFVVVLFEVASLLWLRRRFTILALSVVVALDESTGLLRSLFSLGLPPIGLSLTLRFHRALPLWGRKDL